jgi:hypothetical protein
VILLYPLLLLGAFWVARESRSTAGCAGFWAWALAGGLTSFSFVTGFTIGLLVLPFGVAALLLAARYWPHRAESLGFLAGVGATLLLVGLLATWGGTGFSPLPWLLVGTACAGLAVTGYASLRRWPG